MTPLDYLGAAPRDVREATKPWRAPKGVEVPIIDTARPRAARMDADELVASATSTSLFMASNRRRRLTGFNRSATSSGADVVSDPELRSGL